jgi:hypothetical protein
VALVSVLPFEITMPFELRLRSDATRLDEAPAFLAHVLSDALTWGLGFTPAIEARWPAPSRALERALRARRDNVCRGEVLWTQLDPQRAIAHLVAEDARRARLDLEALGTCLDVVAERALAAGTVVHAPLLGTGLSGGRWREVREVLEARLSRRGVRLIVHSQSDCAPRSG